MKTHQSSVIESEFWAQWCDCSRNLSIQQVACVIKVFWKHFSLINFSQQCLDISLKSCVFNQRTSSFLSRRWSSTFHDWQQWLSRFLSHRRRREDSRDLEIRSHFQTVIIILRSRKFSAKNFHSNNDAKRFLTSFQVLSPKDKLSTDESGESSAKKLNLHF